MESTATESPKKTMSLKLMFWSIVAFLIPLPWMFLEFSGRGEALVKTNPTFTAFITGVGIIGAAFTLSWAAELSERYIPRSLVLITLALISVLPEYAVDLNYAWMAGKDATYKEMAVANMTGANRVLIGIGWAVVAILFWFKFRKQDIELEKSRGLEISLLLIATIYSLIIPLKGTLSLLDTVIFLAMFLYYAGRAMKGERHEEELEGIARVIDEKCSSGIRLIVMLSMFGFAGFAIWLAAHPFAVALVDTGEILGLDKFLLVQWVAPLASESPEIIIAILFTLKGKSSTGIGALISSKVNQWTLLVGAIPFVYGLSAGISHLGSFTLVLDNRQREELLLTSAQSLFAAVIISDYKFSLKEALLLLALFSGQFLFPDERIRYYFSALYIVGAFIMLATSKVKRQNILNALMMK